MTTQSEVIMARYKQVEREADAFGRIIGVRRLRPSEQTKVAGFCAELTGHDEIVGPDGNKVQIPHRMPLVVAAAVCMIDDSHIPFPRNRGELDSIYDRLDAEGLAAAGAALGRLADTEAQEAAKN